MTESINRHVFDLANQHYKDLLRLAKSRRLVHLVSASRTHRNPFYARMLTWLGHWLVVWGWRLQERYGAMTAAPALRVANRTR